MRRYSGAGCFGSGDMKTEDEDEEQHYLEGYNEARNFYAAALDALKAENLILQNRIVRLKAGIMVAKDLIAEDKDNAAFAVLCGIGEEE
jgi:hypothetical protein